MYTVVVPNNMVDRTPDLVPLVSLRLKQGFLLITDFNTVLMRPERESASKKS